MTCGFHHIATSIQVKHPPDLDILYRPFGLPMKLSENCCPRLLLQYVSTGLLHTAPLLWWSVNVITAISGSSYVSIQTLIYPILPEHAQRGQVYDSLEC